PTAYSSPCYRRSQTQRTPQMQQLDGEGLDQAAALRRGLCEVRERLDLEAEPADPFVLAEHHRGKGAPELAGQRGLARARLAPDEVKCGQGQRTRMPSIRQ